MPVCAKSRGVLRTFVGTSPHLSFWIALWGVSGTVVKRRKWLKLPATAYIPPTELASFSSNGRTNAEPALVQLTAFSERRRLSTRQVAEAEHVRLVLAGFNLDQPSSVLHFIFF
jgi:hypothetical protein